MKKTILLILFFIALLPNSFAIMNTTFGGNSSPSLSASDYVICGGAFATDRSKLCASFANSSIFTTSGGPNVTEHHANLTLKTISRSVYTSTAVLSLNTCMDVRIMRSSGSSNSNHYIGGDADATFNNGATASIGQTGGVFVGRWTVTQGADNWQDTTYDTKNGEYNNMTICFLSSSTVDIYFNNSDVGKKTFTSGSLPSTFIFLYVYNFGGTDTSDTLSLDWLAVYNISGAPQAGPTTPDTMPPAITYYNLTSSDNGCEVWNTDKNTACNTSIVTPAVRFNTNEPALCAIAGGSSSTSFNINYTEMGSSRNCTGASSGEGTTNHLCTLISQDELVYDTSYLFISCKDASGNQNSTSTSGALRVSITGLEAAGRNSIELGVRNSLTNSYSIYTDQRIYARNSADSQSTGKFDKVVKKLSKIWAFNRIGPSDSFVNMFNITPVLYTLEIANKTSAQITNQTELLLNATR